MLSSLRCWCFSGDVGGSGHRRGGGEQGEVTSFHSQLAYMKNEICFGHTDLLCGGYHVHPHIYIKCI